MFTRPPAWVGVQQVPPVPQSLCALQPIWTQNPGAVGPVDATHAAESHRALARDERPRESHRDALGPRLARPSFALAPDRVDSVDVAVDTFFLPVLERVRAEKGAVFRAHVELGNHR
jgi:hypothetical protein